MGVVIWSMAVNNDTDDAAVIGDTDNIVALW